MVVEPSYDFRVKDKLTGRHRVQTSAPSLADHFAGPTCRAFAQTWTGWRDQNATVVPDRSRIVPESMGRLLADCLVMDIEGPELEPVIRLAGSRVVDRWGFEPRGMRFRDCMPGEHTEQHIAALRDASRQPCGLRLMREVMRRHGLAYHAEICFLPVHHDERGVCQLFGVSDSDERAHTVDARANPAARESALEITYLDLGAGIPAQSPATPAPA